MPIRAKAYLASRPMEREELERTHILFGEDAVTRDLFYVPERHRYSGTYVIGTQGKGKSGFLETLIHQDAVKGHGIIGIDPHGDLVDNCIAHLPPARLKDTYVLDLLDEEYPFGLNPLMPTKPITSLVERSQAISRLTHIFEVLWEGVLDQQALPLFLQAIAVTFLCNPGTTLVDVTKFLQDPYFRGSLLHKVPDEDVRDFWKYQYDALTPTNQQRIVGPLITRLGRLFMGKPLIRNILGQRETTVDFRRAIEQKEILFIKLPLKQVAEAKLIGTILISQLHAALFSFADMPQEQRPGFSLYVDEFQNFTTPDFEEMFSQGRKFGVRLTLAHQRRDQIPEMLRNATATARNLVVFQVHPDDARELARLFPQSAPAVDLNQLEQHATQQLMVRSVDFPEGVQDFIELYLKPLQGRRKGHKILIHVGMSDIAGNVMNFVGAVQGDKILHEIPVEDPLPDLDSLLYACMKTGHANQPIPLIVARGCANGGIGYFQSVRWMSPDSRDLMPHPPYPAHLVVGGQWTRRPANAKEQFWHFVYSLRQTMVYLAAHPMGKQVKSTPQQMQQALTQLPPRAAWARSDDEATTIYTLNTPRKLSGPDFEARMIGIRQSTRAKYCRPRDDARRDDTRGNGQQQSPQPAQPPMSGGAAGAVRRPAPTFSHRASAAQQPPAAPSLGAMVEVTIRQRGLFSEDETPTLQVPRVPRMQRPMEKVDE